MRAQLRVLAASLVCTAALRGLPFSGNSAPRCSAPRCCEGVACGLHGVSISDAGLVAILSSGGSRYVPVSSASSPEALCLLQLLQGIDLGGLVLPPEILSSIVGTSAVQQTVAF